MKGITCSFEIIQILLQHSLVVIPPAGGGDPLLFRFFKTPADVLGWDSANDLKGSHILGHYCAGTDHSTVANGNTAEDDGIERNQNIISNGDGSALGHTAGKGMSASAPGIMLKGADPYTGGDGTVITDGAVFNAGTGIDIRVFSNSHIVGDNGPGGNVDVLFLGSLQAGFGTMDICMMLFVVETVFDFQQELDAHRLTPLQDGHISI